MSNRGWRQTHRDNISAAVASTIRTSLRNIGEAVRLPAHRESAGLGGHERRRAGDPRSHLARQGGDREAVAPAPACSAGMGRGDGVWHRRPLLGPVLGPQHDVVQHMRALLHREVATAIWTARGSTVPLAVRLAFEFLVLTAARWGEVLFERRRRLMDDWAVYLAGQSPYPAEFSPRGGRDRPARSAVPSHLERPPVQRFTLRTVRGPRLGTAPNPPGMGSQPKKGRASCPCEASQEQRLIRPGEASQASGVTLWRRPSSRSRRPIDGCGGVLGVQCAPRDESRPRSSG